MFKKILSYVAILTFSGSALFGIVYAADKTFSQLPAIPSQSNTDLYAVSANGTGSYKETRSQQMTYAASNLPLTSAKIFVGNGSNLSTAQSLSGDASLANTGVITVSKIGGVPISLAGSFTTSGAFASTFTMTAPTNVTFPTSGTLATTSQIPSFPLSLANGGTNASLTAANNSLVYSTASALGLLATANNGVVVTSAGGVPSVSSTLPSGLTANGNFTASDLLTNANFINNLSFAGGFTGGFSVGYDSSQTQYTTGTMSSSNTTLTGSGTTFTPAMIGGTVVFNDGNYATIGAYTSATQLGLLARSTNSESSQATNIYYGGTNYLKGSGFNTQSGVPTFYLSTGGHSFNIYDTSNNTVSLDTSLLSAGGGIYKFPDLSGAAGTFVVVPATANNAVIRTNSSGVFSAATNFVMTAAQTILGNASGANATGAGTTIFGQGSYNTLTSGTNNMSLGDGNDVASATAIERIAIGHGITVSNNHQMVLGSALTSIISGNAGQTKLGSVTNPWSNVVVGAGSAIAQIVASGTIASTRSYTMPEFGADANFALTTNTDGKVISSITKQVFTATGTYTPTAGMLFCKVRGVGGAGGGGGAASSVGGAGAGGGGGGGAYSEVLLTAAQIGASKAVTIGSGGAGGVGNATGSAGTQTSLGTLMTAPGGGGGSGGANAAASSGGAGGAAGTGDMSVPGGSGGYGEGQAVVTIFTFVGYGGRSVLGAGAPEYAFNGSTAGINGSNYGGGGSGSGSWNGGSSTTGGNGAPGIVYIDEYIAG